MSATREIFVKEMADSVLSRKAWVVTLLCCVLIPLSLVIHQRSQTERDRERQRVRSDYEETLAQMSRRYPDFAGRVPADELEVKIFRNSPELAALGIGLDRELPERITLDLDGITVAMGQIEASASRSLLGHIDLLFLVQFILSLVAVVLSFDLICGERESGTLKLILVNQVSRSRVLAGKMASVLTLLIGPLTLALGLGLLALAGFCGWRPSGSETWIRILALFVLSVLYLGTFLHLGAWVSSLVSRSLTSLVVLLFVWTGVTAILPQGAGLIAQAVYPVDSEVSFLETKSRLREEQLREQMDELRPLAERADYEERRREIVERFQRRFEDRVGQMQRELDRRQEIQARIAFALAAVSPASSLTFAWTAITGSGPSEARRFFDDVSAYQDKLQTTVFDRTFRDLFAGGRARGRIQLVDPQTIPKFEHHSIRLAAALRSIWPQVLMLMLLNLIPALGAHVAFARYDVR